MALNTGVFNVTPGEDPKDRNTRRRIAMQLLMQGADTSPVQHPLQGAGRIAQALLGGYELYQEDEKDKRREAAFQKAFESLPGMGSAPQPPSGSPPSAPQPPAPQF